jgi:hypothetical protein
MKINDVFFQNSNLLCPMNDSSGFFLFSNFRKHCYVDALRIGFMLGFYEGLDYGIESIIGDPNKVTLRIEILTKEGFYTYIDQGFERKDFRHSINKIEMEIGENLKITQLGSNRINWIIGDKSGKLKVNLKLKTVFFHLYPSLIMPNNFSNMAVSPYTEVKGNIIIEDKRYEVDGLGALDQYWSRKIKSNSAKKYGYSHYETIMWDDKYTSVLYYIVSSNKEVYLSDILLSIGGKKLKRLDGINIKHLGYKELDNSFIPTNYSVNAKGDGIEFEYEVKIIDRDKILTSGYPEELLKSWVPNMPFIDAHGFIRKKSKIRNNILNVNGKGILEFLLVDYNPFK